MDGIDPFYHLMSNSLLQDVMDILLSLSLGFHLECPCVLVLVW